MSQEGSSRKESPAEPIARPVELHADLYREIFAHSREAIAIIDPEGYLPSAKRRPLHNARLRRRRSRRQNSCDLSRRRNLPANFRSNSSPRAITPEKLCAAPRAAKKETSNFRYSLCAAGSANRSATSVSSATSPREKELKRSWTNCSCVNAPRALTLRKPTG